MIYLRRYTPGQRAVIYEVLSLRLESVKCSFLFQIPDVQKHYAYELWGNVSWRNGIGYLIQVKPGLSLSDELTIVCHEVYHATADDVKKEVVPDWLTALAAKHEREDADSQRHTQQREQRAEAGAALMLERWKRYVTV